MSFAFTTPTAAKQDVQFQRIPITVNKITEEKSDGKNIALIGNQYSGKTFGMLSGMYLNLEFKDLFSEKYPAVTSALKNGYIPETTKGFIIESENKLNSHINQLPMKEVFKDILDGRLDIVSIPPAARRDRMNKDRSVEVDIGSIERIENVYDMYVQCMEVAEKDYRNHETMIGLDSGSRLYNLLNTRNEILIQKRTPRGASEETIKNIRQASWKWRNSWWDEIFTILRGHKGFVYVTFMSTPIPKQWREDGGPLNNVLWEKHTPFNMDQIYEFYIDPSKKQHIKMHSSYNSRIMPHDGSIKTDWLVDTSGKLSVFPAIEQMVKDMGEW